MPLKDLTNLWSDTGQIQTSFIISGFQFALYSCACSWGSHKKWYYNISNAGVPHGSIS